MGLEFLTMSWIYAMPAFVGGLVLLYFLKLKRRVVVTSSTFLWHRALNDLRVNSPLQRLRMNLLLLLQLLALILLLLALARPVSNVGGLNWTDSILLIDISASMKTKDADGGTRFEKAIEEARRIVEDLSRNDRAIVIAFSDEVRVLTDMTDSKALLLEALDGLEPTDRPTLLANAMNRVRALLDTNERQPELYIFSDGIVGDLTQVVLEEKIPLHFVRVGEQAANVGIVGIDVAVASGLGDDTRLFVSIQNTGFEKPKTVGVDFYLEKKIGSKSKMELVDSREVTISPGGVGSVPFEVPLFDETTPTRRVEVRLDERTVKDAFPTDDVVYALIKERETIRVLVVTGGNLFLHLALNEDPLIWKTPRGDVPLMAPEDFDPSDQSLQSWDVIVLDRFTPKDLPAGSYLCFGARPPFEDFKDVGQVEGSQVLDWDETHEVSRFVNFATLILPTSRRFQVADRHKLVVRGTQGPIVIDARDKDRRALVCSFDLMAFPIEGAWTFDPSFPIFLANAIRALGSSVGDRRKTTLVRTGTTAQLRFPSSARSARIKPPHADTYELTILEGDDLLHLTQLDRAGIYEVTFLGEEGQELRSTQVAVNLANAAESTIKPAEELQLEGRQVVAVSEAVESNQDVWKLVAMAALAFVMLEWWLYNRRVFI